MKISLMVKLRMAQVIYDEKGEFLKKINYLNGLKNGLSEEYYHTEQVENEMVLKKSGYYKNGLRHGSGRF